jgi:hypothetical protein
MSCSFGTLSDDPVGIRWSYYISSSKDPHTTRGCAEVASILTKESNIDKAAEMLSGASNTIIQILTQQKERRLCNPGIWRRNWVRIEESFLLDQQLCYYSAVLLPCDLICRLKTL